METAVSPDNLQSISGIGTAAEQALHAHNIYFFSEIAAKSPEELYELAKSVKGITAKRIGHEDWPGQARKLLKPQGAEEGTVPPNGQHYATYQIKLLLEADNQVRYTNATYLQKQEGETWAGWDAQKMIAFIEKSAQLAPTALESGQEAEDKLVSPSETILTVSLEETAPVFHQLDVYRSESALPRHLIQQQDEFNIQFEAEIPGLQAQKITGELNVYARDLSSEKRAEIGRISEEVVDGLWRSKLHGKSLAAGTYRLEAELNLKTAQFTKQIEKPLQGGILIVI
ncbi:MAG: hypothetical protein R6X34_30100 [Chloroflexota bacterium]